MANPFILTHIRRLPLFANCTPEQLDAAAGAFQQARWLPQQALYRQGELSGGMYLLVSGGAQILRTDPDGTARVQSVVKPGEYVGEASLFTNQARDVSVVAAQESVVLFLTKQAFDALLKARPDIRAALVVRPDLQPNIPMQRATGASPDETVLLTTRRHPWAFARKALRGAFLFAALWAFAVLSNNLPSGLRGFAVLGFCGVGLLLPGALWVYWFLDWRNDYYTITDQRIIDLQRDLLTGEERRDQVLLSNVQNVNIARNGYIAELIGFGDLILTTAGSDQPFVLDQIPDPAKAQRIIFDQLQAHPAAEAAASQAAIRAEVNKVLAGGTVSPAPAAPPPMMQPTATTFSLLPRMRTVSGNQIIYRKHWLILVRNLARPGFSVMIMFVFIILRLFGAIPVIKGIAGGTTLVIVLAWSIGNALWLLWEYLLWQGDQYIIDDQTVTDIIRLPFGLRESRMQAGLQQIQNVTSAIVNLWGSVFNYGNVSIQTAARSGQMEFTNVSNPAGVAEEILQRVKQFSKQQSASEQEAQLRAMTDMLSAYHQATQPGAQNPPPDQTQPGGRHF